LLAGADHHAMFPAALVHFFFDSDVTFRERVDLTIFPG
jgi:hypothetical protein